MAGNEEHVLGGSLRHDIIHIPPFHLRDSLGPYAPGTIRPVITSMALSRSQGPTRSTRLKDQVDEGTRQTTYTLKIESRHDANFVISGAKRGCYDEKIDIMTTFDFPLRQNKMVNNVNIFRIFSLMST